MSGRRIDDHSFWAGKGSKGSVFPDGPHKVEVESSVVGDGALSHYEDNDPAIKSQQEHSVRKAKGHAQKPGMRY